MDIEAYKILKEYGFIKMDMPSKLNFIKRFILSMDVEIAKNVILNHTSYTIEGYPTIGNAELELRRLELSSKKSKF